VVLFLSHVEIIDSLLMYSNNPGEKMPPKFNIPNTDSEITNDDESSEEIIPQNYQYINIQNDQEESEEEIEINIDDDDGSNDVDEEDDEDEY